MTNLPVYNLGVSPVPGYAEWRIEMMAGATGSAVACDRTLGGVMTAFSSLLHQIAVFYEQPIRAEAPSRALGAIPLDTFIVETINVAPIGYKITMISGKYTYVCYISPNLEHLIRAMAGAMLFFGKKYRIIKLYDGVARAYDAAHEQGFETQKEEH